MGCLVLFVLTGPISPTSGMFVVFVSQGERDTVEGRDRGRDVVYNWSVDGTQKVRAKVRNSFCVYSRNESVWSVRFHLFTYC